MPEFLLKGRKVVEGRCKGLALVTTRSISFLGSVDPNRGVIVDRNHDLYGESIKDKVLCFPHGSGSTVGSYVLYSLKKKRLAPKAILNSNADPVIVVGAIISDIPMMDQVDIMKIKTGDCLYVDAFTGKVKVTRRGGN